MFAKCRMEGSHVKELLKQLQAVNVKDIVSIVRKDKVVEFELFRSARKFFLHVNDIKELALWSWVPALCDLYSMTTTTWLTSDEKCDLMCELEDEEDEGLLDGGSLEPLLTLNQVDGLASAYSCIGHPQEATGGYLALRVSREVAEIMDGGVIEKLWSDGLIYSAEKQWQYAYDVDNQPIPRVRFILRFPLGFMDKVCEAIYHYISGEQNANL